MGNVLPPSAGLGSNSNYFLFDACNNLSGVAVTIGVASDMVASAGFGFQLNGYSPAGETCIWQQYAILVDASGQMGCMVDNWENYTTQLFNNLVPLYRLPSAALPAGYTCTIALETDSSSRVASATFTVSAPAPASGTALSSFVDTFGEHVYCIGSNVHLHQLLSDRPNWLDNDLTKMAGATTKVANGSGLTSFVDGFGEHVCYIGTDANVHKLMTPPGAPWQDNDLTKMAGATTKVANRSALTSFVDSFGEHVCYIGADGDVHKLITIGGGGWQDNDLTKMAGATTKVANGSGLTSFVDGFGEHVCYIGTDANVHKLMTPPGAPWQDNDLTKMAGATTKVANGSALTSFVDSFGEHVCYIGADGDVHKLITIGGGGWQDNDLTKMAGATTKVANGSGLTAFVDGFGEHVCYIGADGHVHKLMTPPGAPWQDNDLTKMAGGPQAANGTALTSFVDSFGEHVCYIAADGYVHQLITIGGGAWEDQNLTSVKVSQNLLTPLPFRPPLTPVDLAPIAAFELDIVGFDNGQSTTFSSGSGTIAYNAALPMTVINTQPLSCCPVPIGTAETANTAYGGLPTGSSSTFVQSFTISATTIKAPKGHAFRLVRRVQPAASGVARPSGGVSQPTT